MTALPEGSGAPDATTAPGLTACSLCAGETLAGRDPHPGGQLARLQALERDGVARLTLSECLDRCERGDVVVARPVRSRAVGTPDADPPAPRRRSARPVWFERVAGDDLTRELADWLRAGGPGAAPLPPALRPYVIPRTPRTPD